MSLSVIICVDVVVRWVPCDSHSPILQISWLLQCSNVKMTSAVWPCMMWVPCDSHSSLSVDSSHLLLVATTFKCQDGISCLGILTIHDVICLHVISIERRRPPV